MADKKESKITKDMPIGDIVSKHPETIEVFFNHNLHCIGCAAAQFETLEEGAQVHGINVDVLVKDLNNCIKKNSKKENKN
ncbi:DUF1858 domain-containing protein [Candidatus Woesearchaeota archaeon]|jgi:hybrid cluster-associated redox disulfide protein|nr:DUF1858 domain-containing protein [Candidatus Woesearchaeota archaeon]MBT6519269.1 DUF1858 domain-containing protein [Candidatus Woesearchaeota archaeon]MBT7368461.1 DUF1858 domain-containing protein [Candidatus Woesearchaeota archaeon]